jgi:hypothetical protein
LGNQKNTSPSQGFEHVKDKQNLTSNVRFAVFCSDVCPTPLSAASVVTELSPYGTCEDAQFGDRFSMNMHCHLSKTNPSSAQQCWAFQTF